MPEAPEILATACLALAILHTFFTKFFARWGTRCRAGSFGRNVFHLLGEVEIVFGLWAGLFLLFLASSDGSGATWAYIKNRHFTEPLFAFVIMAISASRPILGATTSALRWMARWLPLPAGLGLFLTILTCGPLLGSLITEPAAMTVTALILLEQFFRHPISTPLRYATLGLLFVNISIGGTLTPYAAPPVLMVANQWGWDLPFMFTHFGWKAITAIGLSNLVVALWFRQELSALATPARAIDSLPPLWVMGLHILVLSGVVLAAHQPLALVGLFLLFLGVTSVTREFQSALKLKEALLVAVFLGGLVVLGGKQSWWLEPLLGPLSAFPLYLGAIGLTAVVDNAALTYLGSQVPGLSDLSKYALVAGSVVGGGLTVIANAPNPAGHSLLNPSFGANGISPLELLRGALLPTFIAALVFWIF